MGVRVFLLAKELNLTTKQIMDVLKESGIEVASHLASVQDDVADALRRKTSGGAAAAPPRRAAGAAEKGASEKAPTVAPKSGGAASGTRPTAPPMPPSVFVPKPAVRPVGPIIVRRPVVTPPRPEPGAMQGRPQRMDRPGSMESAPARGRSDFGGAGRFDAPRRPDGPPSGRMDAPPTANDPDRRRRVRFFPGQTPSYGGGGGGGGGAGSSERRGRHAGSGGRRQERFSDDNADRRGGRPGKGGRRPTMQPLSASASETVIMEKPSAVTVSLPLTLKDLSPVIGVKQSQILQLLMRENVMVHINSSLTEEMLLLIGEKFGVDITVQESAKLESTLDELEAQSDPAEQLVPRPPVVTFLGHVDHGKTSLLDKIRETRVALGEAGGITQHMSAYRVDHNNRHVVFIDTPGHKAFTEMRARGANVTDVVVLVVAADDGPMPQTEEAIQHAQAANVPIVVALNKIDRPAANVARTKQQLTALGLTPPEWGGNTEMVEVSALTGQGIDALLEVLTLETEILELKANPNRAAIGTILDAKATTGRGIVTTALIQNGTLRPGDTVLCGAAWGRVRTLQSTTGVVLEAAGPATPIELTGLDSIPEAGDRLYSVEQERARTIADERKRKVREAERAIRSHVTLENLMSHLSKSTTKEVKVIVKVDVNGSKEVVRDQIQSLSTDEVRFRILLAGVGEISESDVTLADASDALIIGFHVVANERARSLAKEKNVEIRTYQVLYQLGDDMHQALEGLLSPELSEEIMATVEIRQVFKSSKLGNIAGCMVKSGAIRRDNPVRLIRDGSIVYQGKLASLKRGKDDASDVKEGFECGLVITDYDDIKVGDVVESFRIVKKARKLGNA
ncbi:MAG: translation initiation factor IF-2 [Planctomycetota bacterium]